MTLIIEDYERNEIVSTPYTHVNVVPEKGDVLMLPVAEMKTVEITVLSRRFDLSNSNIHLVTDYIDKLNWKHDG